MNLELATNEIRGSNARIYIACSGGGAGLQALLWSVPGCSSFLVGAAFPYSTEAIDEFLRFAPERYCTPETAIDLAMESLLRAGAGPDAIGIGLTASVASTTTHRGAHRVHAAWVSARGVRTHCVLLKKGTGSEQRRKDGAVSDWVGINALLDALGKPSISEMPNVLSYAQAARDELARERFFCHPFFRANGARAKAPPVLSAALPGSFDPPHRGHFGMADAFTERTGLTATFLVTAEPPHKAHASVCDLLHRARLLRGRDVLFTRGEPLYIDKARVYPGCAFVIGADALARMLDPLWGHSVESLVAEFRALGTSFYVASRVVAGGLLTLDDIPNVPRDLCSMLPGRWDVSSTELRRA